MIQDLAEEKGVTVLFGEDTFADVDIVSGSLEATSTFDQMLSVLQAQVGFVWERRGNDYMIYPEKFLKQ